MNSKARIMMSRAISRVRQARTRQCRVRTNALPGEHSRPPPAPKGVRKAGMALQGLQTCRRMPEKTLQGLQTCRRLPEKTLQGLQTCFRLPEKTLQSLQTRFRLPEKTLQSLQTRRRLPEKTLQGISGK